MAKYEKLRARDEEKDSFDLESIEPPTYKFHEATQFQTVQHSSSRIKYLVPTLWVTIVAMLGLAAWIIVIKNPKPFDYHSELGNSGGALTSCGHSSSEALAAGCHFDVFSFGWHPPECSDMALYNYTLEVLEEQRADDPIFFRKSPGPREVQEPVPYTLVQQYAKGGAAASAVQGIIGDDTELLGTWEHYLVSCTYAWQKVQRAAMKNWPIDEWSSSYTLAVQCGADLWSREKKQSSSVSSSLRVKYFACGLSLEDLKKNLDRDLQLSV